MKTQMIVWMTVLLLGSTTAFAQQAPSAEERASRELEMMKKDLSLTEEQEAKVKTILTSYAAQEDSLRKNSKDDPSEAKKQRTALQDKKDAELKAVLTEEQYQKLQEKRKTRPEGSGQGGQHKGGGKSH